MQEGGHGYHRTAGSRGLPSCYHSFKNRITKRTVCWASAGCRAVPVYVTMITELSGEPGVEKREVWVLGLRATKEHEEFMWGLSRGKPQRQEVPPPGLQSLPSFLIPPL